MTHADMAVGVDHLLARENAVGDDQILNQAVEAGKALWQALRGVDIAANLMPVATAAENDGIWINIGVKPLPELTITATASGEAKSEGAATATVK